MRTKSLTTLDRFVLDFTELLEECVDYVIVSGYVVILFGRTCVTDDIDTIIRYIDRDTFASFYQRLSRDGYHQLLQPFILRTKKISAF